LKKIITQIYEVQTPAEAEQLIALGVDHIGGVVVSKQEWKLPSLKESIQCVNDSNARSSLIPLFSDLDMICLALDYYQPDIVHFCEDLVLHYRTHGHCHQLIRMQKDVKSRFPHIEIMRSIPIAQPGMVQHIPIREMALLFEPVSDYFLTDTILGKSNRRSSQDQPVQGFIGITGLTCDWEIAATLAAFSKIPVILAGGLSPDNVYDAILKVRPSGVDSCTQTNAVDSEGRPVRFIKDINKTKRFVDQTRRAQNWCKNKGLYTKPLLREH
jgi:phosphoribosylanthranilate isomerase